MISNSSLTIIQSSDSMIDPIVEEGQFLILLLQMRNVAGSEADGHGASVSLLLPQMKIVTQHLGFIDVLIFVAPGMASCGHLRTSVNFKDSSCENYCSATGGNFC
jgi:hypothetical protein